MEQTRANHIFNVGEIDQRLLNRARVKVDEPSSLASLKDSLKKLTDTKFVTNTNHRCEERLLVFIEGCIQERKGLGQGLEGELQPGQVGGDVTRLPSYHTHRRVTNVLSAVRDNACDKGISHVSLHAATAPG